MTFLASSRARKTLRDFELAQVGDVSGKTLLHLRSASSWTDARIEWTLCETPLRRRPDGQRCTLLEQAAADHPGLRKVWVDGGYRKHFVEHAATLGIDLEIAQRTPGAKGFTPAPKRWAVERTYGWLMLHRRLARDYETHPHRSEAMIHLAMTDLMARRLTGENTISWRDPTPAHQSRIQG
jgi:transposase